jgi:hypothetical protein
MACDFFNWEFGIWGLGVKGLGVAALQKYTGRMNDDGCSAFEDHAADVVGPETAGPVCEWRSQYGRMHVQSFMPCEGALAA